jgi:hypothetical protein
MYMFINFELNYHRKLLQKTGCNYLFWTVLLREYDTVGIANWFFHEHSWCGQFRHALSKYAKKNIPSWLSFIPQISRIFGLLNLLLAMYMFINFELNYHRKLLQKTGCNYLLPFWNCDIFFTAIKIRPSHVVKLSKGIRYSRDCQMIFFMNIRDLVNFDMLFPNMQRKIYLRRSTWVHPGS